MADNIWLYIGPALGLILLGLLALWEMRKEKLHQKEYSDLPWAPMLGGRCRARLKRGQDPAYWGRCELKKGHNDVEIIDHALERGMVWVRWYKGNSKKNWVRYEEPSYGRKRK